MPDIAALIASGATNPWLYLPAALLLGALHALEPGHSKSLMAAYIVAIRGTAGQAVLLGLSAAIGHTLIVWGLAGLGLWFGDALIGEKAEPWLMLMSGLLVMLLAGWMLARLMRGEAACAHDHGHDGHDHGHHGHHNHLGHHGHHGHHGQHGAMSPSRGAIIWFGFTGGLLPCPSAIAVLLICLQVGAVGLGVAMVAAFSAGLALTLVAVGLAAAWGATKAAARWPAFEAFAARLPWLSGALILTLGLAMAVAGAGRLGWL